MKLLITGGTVFVSRFTAEYFVKKGHEVFVLNRGSRRQVNHTTLIQADRHKLIGELEGHFFDAVLDICAYDGGDVVQLLDGLRGFGDYILISSSAVYPETLPQPFCEHMPVGENSIWKDYGMGKIAAEKSLMARFSQGYILRPPYLYGPMQNLYRETFVFECAERGRRFYVPGDGSMKLQFFHVEDLCRMMEQILLTHPKEHIVNVGNKEKIDVNTFASLGYETVGARLETVSVTADCNQRNYFSFHNYEYTLDTSVQDRILPDTKLLEAGLRESYQWFMTHQDEVLRKPYFEFIDQNLAR